MDPINTSLEMLCRWHRSVDLQNESSDCWWEILLKSMAPDVPLRLLQLPELDEPANESHGGVEQEVPAATVGAFLRSDANYFLTWEGRGHPLASLCQHLGNTTDLRWALPLHMSSRGGWGITQRTFGRWVWILGSRTGRPILGDFSSSSFLITIIVSAKEGPPLRTHLLNSRAQTQMTALLSSIRTPLIVFLHLFADFGQRVSLDLQLAQCWHRGLYRPCFREVLVQDITQERG